MFNVAHTILGLVLIALAVWFSGSSKPLPVPSFALKVLSIVIIVLGTFNYVVESVNGQDVMTIVSNLAMAVGGIFWIVLICRHVEVD